MTDPGRIFWKKKKKFHNPIEISSTYVHVQESIIETLELNSFEVEELFSF